MLTLTGKLMILVLLNYKYSITKNTRPCFYPGECMLPRSRWNLVALNAFALLGLALVLKHVFKPQREGLGDAKRKFE